ncbi:hypothetical protein DSL72_000419 [Monilinia vaccinii-corymbosi]|uniref:Uncharacterized protein n=1 Tax=Monilinia vaccinii-corymbosi TaxID=61207 RepID=A0A8A3P6C0_9HELO|nr:hypothetical protein DSL72_000419 [Monilinia vaccinii-corymbosi]
MNIIRHKSRVRRCRQTFATIPEDGVVPDWNVRPLATKSQRRIAAAGSRHPPENRTQPLNFSESSILDIRLMHPSRTLAFPPTPLESSTTTTPPIDSGFPTLVRTSSMAGIMAPAKSTIVDNHPTLPQNTRNNSNPLDPAPPARVDPSADVRRNSIKERIYAAMRDLWVEVKSRVKGECQSKRKAKKEKEFRRRESVARSKAVDADMVNLIIDHRKSE